MREECKINMYKHKRHINMFCFRVRYIFMIGEYITMWAANPTENLSLLIVYPIKQKTKPYFMSCKIVFSSI